METQQDIATLEKIVAEKQKLYERYDLLANQSLNSDPNVIGGVGLRAETWNALERAKLAKKELEIAQQKLEQAKQHQPTQPSQPEPETPAEQGKDEPIETPQPDQDDDTQQPQDDAAAAQQTTEPEKNTGTNILNALTKKFSGNKILDALINKGKEKHE